MADPSVTNAVFKALFNLPTPSPMSDTFNCNLPLNFTNCTTMQSNSGEYTPNNDYLYLYQGFTQYTAPNIVLITSDQQLNVQMVFSDGSVRYMVTQRFNFLSWVPNPGAFLTSIFIEGRTGNVSQPMPQGQPVTYLVLVAQATLS